MAIYCVVVAQYIAWWWRNILRGGGAIYCVVVAQYIAWFARACIYLVLLIHKFSLTKETSKKGI